MNSIPALAVAGNGLSVVPGTLALALVGVLGILDYLPGGTALKSLGGDSGDGDGASNGTNGDGEENVEAVNEAHLDEAARRLEERGERFDGENLRRALDEVLADAQQATPSRAVPSQASQGDAQVRSVAPDKIEEHQTYLVRTGENGEERYVRELIVSSFPSRVAYGWLDQLYAGDANVRISYHLWPRDPDSMMRKLNVRSTRLRGQIQRKQEKGNINTTEEEQQLEEVERLREELTRGNTRLFDFAMYIEVIGETKEELDDRTAQVRQILAQSNARITPLYDRQLEAQRSVAPLGNDTVKNTQVMDTNALGTTFPFIEPSVVQPSGVLFGFHNVTGTPVVVDRWELSGHNMLISGKIGSGKSYLAKLAIWRRLEMDPETDVLIIDPVGGMGDLVDAIGGQRIQVGGNSVINPMEISQSSIDEDEEEDINPYEQKIRSVMGMFNTHFQGRRELTKEEEGILRRSIRLAYLQQGITPDTETHGNESPTIQDVLDVLHHYANGKRPSEFLDVAPEHEPYISSIERTEEGDASSDLADHAHSVLLGLEDFQEGGQNSNLNGETTVRLDQRNRVFQFDLSQAVQGSTPLMMHVVLDWLFQRARTSDRNTLVAIDEAHYMLGQEEALDMLELFARHSRHYNSGMTLISQTVDEFMQNDQARAIYDQCDIRALMRHENIGDEALEALDLTERERRFVLQAQAGNSADFSQSLLYVTDVGKLRVQVRSSGYEHHVVEEDLNPWAYLYRENLVEWEQIPEGERAEVRQQL